MKNPLERETAEVYVVKYALTKGIYKTTVLLSRDGGSYCIPTDARYVSLRMGRDCFRDRGEAELAASNLAAKKRDSLLKQLKKVQDLIANPKWVKP